MNTAAPSLQTAEALLLRQPDCEQSSGLSDLFMPLDDLLVGGGDPRLLLDPRHGLNEYGCGPFPSSDTWCVASSTASPISERAYARAGLAREKLMRSAIAVGFERAFDARVEEMRDELRARLRLSTAEADVVFSPSGTDSQIHALFLARALLGPRLKTVIVGSDQTGSGTAFTSRGRHFSFATAGGRPVRKDTPVVGLACDSVALPLLGATADIGSRANDDLQVLDAIESAITSGSGVLLQIMDSSKLGWRAPSEACLDEIAERWPDEVQVVVDACQMRLSRRRLRTHLDRGHMVLVTGSKYFGGPAFSGALFVPTRLARMLDRGEGVPPGLLDYAAGSDWPTGWARLRARFPYRPNLGQWLRWEAALEEIKAYYDVPDEYRAVVLREFRAAIESMIALSPSLSAVGTCAHMLTGDDEEFSGPTIFPFTLRRGRDPVPAADCRLVHQALMRDLGELVAGSKADRDLAARRCLVGQPVRIERAGEKPAAALRLCIGARLVSEIWSPDPDVSRHNLQRELDHIAGIVAKIELVLGKASTLQSSEPRHGH